MRGVTLVGGPPGAGKSSVGKLLCARSELGVHLDVDKFVAFVRAGFVWPWLPDARIQNETAVRAVARAAGAYVEAGYDVVVDGFVRRWSVAVFVSELAPSGAALSLVVLLPSLDVVASRVASRAGGHGVPESVLPVMYQEIVEDGFEGHRVDSSGLTLEETVDVVVRERAAGRLAL